LCERRYSRVKNQFKAKLLFWSNIKSKKLNVALICLFVSLIGLKVFTTVLRLIGWQAFLANKTEQ
jgi:hypothetical protein